tara:strand:+ start:622 stop:861 length:240 start_codon:yes stop_codon:yes gene_type:complete
MDLTINNMISNINKLENNKEDNFKKLFILKKIEEINEICNTSNFRDIKNNELKEDIEINNKIKKIFPYLLYIINFYDTN